MVRITTGYGLHMNLIWICVFDDAYISREMTIFVCYQFFKSLRKKFGRRKAIFTDGALDGIYGCL